MWETELQLKHTQKKIRFAQIILLTQLIKLSLRRLNEHVLMRIYGSYFQVLKRKTSLACNTNLKTAVPFKLEDRIGSSYMKRSLVKVSEAEQEVEAHNKQVTSFLTTPVL